MSLSAHIDNKNKSKDILILGEGPTHRLDDTTLTAEAKYSVNFTRPRKRFAIKLNYYRSKSFLFVNATKIYRFKAKDSEMKDYTMCLRNISRDFVINNMIKRWKWNVMFFSVGFNPIDTNDIIVIYKYIMKGK